MGGCGRGVSDTEGATWVRDIRTYAGALKLYREVASLVL